MIQTACPHCHRLPCQFTVNVAGEWWCSVVYAEIVRAVERRVGSEGVRKMAEQGNGRKRRGAKR